jgi:hypothetical protein
MPPRTRPGGPPPANPRAAIQDWLNLVEPDGAFLTTTELLAAFPSGFDPMDAVHRTELRARVAELDADPQGGSALRRWLLRTALDWDDQLAEGQRIPVTASVRSAEHGVQLRPDAVLLDVDDPNRVRLGVFTWPAGTRLDRRPDVVTAGDIWPATPVQRAETWCREAGVPLALVTDDDQWVLVWARRGAPAASCRWRTSDLADERILQSGIASLLGARRFFAVTEDQTLERLFERAADAEAEITKGLGLSVRRSVELLIAAMSRDDVASGGEVLDGVPGTEVYEASVSVLMRLVFLLFAEERRLLPAEDPLWAESYSVLTLRDDLRTVATRDGEDALERRATAWHRLLATFRAVHGGANHDRLSLPAYGGSLFDPDRFPFLEGRCTPDHLVVDGVDLGPAGEAPVGSGRPVAIDDRTILAILDALLNVQVKVGRSTVTQRVSYKALDVEQIGHCYEGLLDHGCTPVQELALGLIGPEGAEPELTVVDLEAHLADGDDALCEWLSDKTRCAKKPSALARELAREPEGIDLARLRVACGHDDATVERVLPFWGLIRTDLRGLPIVLLPGSQYVTQTSTRRNMGAQYTTKSLAEEVVRYALEPLVYEPGPQNEADPEKWQLRTPAEILDLRVCDPAVGSGAILTAAGRYLADRLVESVVQHGAGEGRFASRLADLAAAPDDEQTVLARREVVDHCLYGVDKNPVAAEMAKLSLWLTTMARERPFTFLDHAIQVGDSLLGITDLEQLRWLHLDPSARQGKAGFETLTLDLRLKEAAELARRLQELSVVTVRDAAEKQRLHDELRAKLADLSVVADTVVGAALSTAGKGGVSMEQRLDPQLDRIRTALDDDRPEIEREAALTVLRSTSTAWLRTDLPDEVPMPWDRQCLHWPLAFPEVFLEDGRRAFDAMVANPPFLGGRRISGALGGAFREHVVAHVAGRQSGGADLVVYFLLRMASLSSAVGTLATNTVGQGDSREVGLDRLVAGDWSIRRAVRSEPWPTDANLEIAKVWLWRGPWLGVLQLDGREVTRISPSLERGRRVEGPPHQLVRNSDQAFQGVNLGDLGFLVDEDLAGQILERHPDWTGVLRPFVNGQVLTESPTQTPDRWVVDFANMSSAEASRYPELWTIVSEKVKPVVLAKNGYPGWAKRWWQFWNVRPALRTAVEGLGRVIALAQVSKVVLPVFMPLEAALSHKTVVFAYEDFAHFGVLTGAPHWWWGVSYSSTLETRVSYAPTDAFSTYPQPEPEGGLAWQAIATRGEALHTARSALMIGEGLGLTKTYNLVHDPDEKDPDIVRLRELHVELDHAVRDAYGWSDLALDHHHWETPQGMRFTVSPAAKDELLDRLLELNHERYATEVAAGLHDKKKPKKAAAKRGPGRADPGQETLL